jgi:hypothetical protein
MLSFAFSLQLLLKKQKPKNTVRYRSITMKEINALACPNIFISIPSSLSLLLSGLLPLRPYYPSVPSLPLPLFLSVSLPLPLPLSLLLSSLINSSLYCFKIGGF